jgi:hypothetical protein
VYNKLCGFLAKVLKVAPSNGIRMGMGRVLCPQIPRNLLSTCCKDNDEVINIVSVESKSILRTVAVVVGNIFEELEASVKQVLYLNLLAIFKGKKLKAF